MTIDRVKGICNYCGFSLVMDGKRRCCRAGREYDNLGQVYEQEINAHTVTEKLRMRYRDALREIGARTCDHACGESLRVRTAIKHAFDTTSASKQEPT